MEQERCYACLDLLFAASLEERRAYKRDCCGTSFHHNCVRPEYLQSECVSCNEHRKTVSVPDLVLIDEERRSWSGQKTYALFAWIQNLLATNF